MCTLCVCIYELDICQRLLGSHKLRNSQDISHLSSSSSSSSINNNNHNHNGAICPRTLGLRDSVRFIDYGEDYDYMNLHNVHTSSLPSAPPPTTTTTTTIEDIGFRNPAFLECDKYGYRSKCASLIWYQDFLTLLDGSSVFSNLIKASDIRVAISLYRIHI
ncbi:unnamed protein product [Schistosoma mattheei]|uniref:Uncharacterized protein n=1 Tax=Schistosoma mattheei TaxID=31246 RepID=A0A183PX89_9TREM|nr:unnamed protein product [Schistosoma mattheei]